jgi:membrane-bound lytic murein transglycosylase D
VPTSVIRKLNPDVLGKELPPGKGDLLVNVPPESVSRAIAAMPAMLEGHKLRIDDDMVDPLDLMSPDGFRPRATESDESLLALLPKPKKKRRALRDPLGEGLDDLAALDSDAKLPQGVEDPAPKRRGGETVLYRVGKGDSLEEIARQFETSAADLARENDLTLGSKLKEGTLLRMTVSTAPAKASPTKGDRSDEERPKSKRRSAG